MESRDTDPRFKQPVLTVNALHTPLYEQARTDGMGTVELPATAEEVIRISSIHSTYAKPEVQNARHQLKTEMRARKRKLLKKRRDIVRTRPYQLPKGTSLEERSVKRRKSWGPAIATGEVACKVNAEALSKRWNIGLKRAQMTIDATTQKGIRTVRNSLNKRLPTQPYRLKRTAPGRWFTDTFHARDPSITRQDKAAQVFSNGKGYVEFIPILSKSRCHDGLNIFISEVGIPEHLVSDGAMEEGGYGSYKTKWNELQRKYQFKQTFIQPHVPRQNTAELDIGHLRREISRRTSLKCSPLEIVGILRDVLRGD